MATSGGTKHTKFRLGPATLAMLDDLAVSAGSRARALREAVAGWYGLVLAAATDNASSFSAEDWERLSRLDPDAHETEVGGLVFDDWSARLVREMVGQWVDSPRRGSRRAMAPGAVTIRHNEIPERAACRRLADRLKRLTPAGVYAMVAALRHFWSHKDLGENLRGAWWEPQVWLAYGEAG